MTIEPPDLRYTREHTWARLEGDGRITVGITDFAQTELGEITSVELPPVGTPVEGGDTMGEIQSDSTVWDLYAPVSGLCDEQNLEAKENPPAVNQDPYGEGWLAVIKPSDPPEFDGLMSSEEYSAFLEEEV